MRKTINNLEKLPIKNISKLKEQSLDKMIHNQQVGKATGFLKEFKEFAFKGNVIDLAVGLIIGTAFNNLIQSFIKDLIMPPIGRLMGNVDFSDLYINLSGKTFSTFAEAEASGLPIIRYGRFITTFIDFTILALTVFIILKFFLQYKSKDKN